MSNPKEGVSMSNPKEGVSMSIPKEGVSMSNPKEGVSMSYPNEGVSMLFGGCAGLDFRFPMLMLLLCVGGNLLVGCVGVVVHVVGVVFTLLCNGSWLLIRVPPTLSASDPSSSGSSSMNCSLAIRCAFICLV